ncbi:MAG: ribonuclease R family protein [Kiritimatiellia bacterium]
MNERKAKIGHGRPPQKAGTLTGELHMARNGAGFLLEPDTDKAVWIETPDLGTALPGDTVTIRLKRTPPRAGEGACGLGGCVLRIDRRAERSIVGTVVGAGRFVRVRPLNPVYRQEFVVPGTKGAKLGERVVMRFVRWDNPRLAPQGEISDVIGPADNPSLDTLSILKQYDLPEAFPPPVLSAAEEVSARLANPGKRLDLRRKYIFTCDPATARDFDDALSLEVDKAGRRVLGVHIADVSHFVTPGSVLDKEAYKRSTSVYLVDKVVPMLPEQLSNGVCSLVPGEDRLAFSVFLTFDAKGICVARSFAKSIIRSKARFTYEQVLAELRGETNALKPRERKVLFGVHELAQQMRAARFAAGALDMDVPEAEIKLDAQGMMTGIEVRPYDESHQMVEECMVAANEAVARELWPKGVKILARLHGVPDAEKLEELRGNLAKLGVSCGDLSNRKNLGRFLKKIKGSPLESVLSVMVLRAMKRAVYSAREIGHYGLAKDYYAHFTSPIRRYPDLVLHRQLAAWIAGKGGRLDPAWLNRAALNATECEQVADEAERALTEIKKYRYLQAVLNGSMKGVENCFEAVVGKVAHYGLFVDLPSLAIGGMVHVSRLSDAYVRWDEFSETLSGGGTTWRVGMKMNVRVAEIDFDQRKIDFVPVRPKNGRDTPKTRTAKPKRSRPPRPATGVIPPGNPPEGPGADASPGGV